MSEFVFTVPREGVTQSQLNVSSGAPTPEIRVRPYRKACIACRDRKVKCDKQAPCSNCQKLLLECSFPSPFRPSSRQPKGSVAEKSKESETELLERIKKLELAVQDLSELKNEVLRSRKRRKGVSPEGSDVEDDQSFDGGENEQGEAEAAGSMERDVGKLVVEEGKSRYISGGFWAGLEEDVSHFLRCESDIRC
jgi:hypothetical protein